MLNRFSSMLRRFSPYLGSLFRTRALLSLTIIVAAALATLAPSSAEAIPAFARRTGMHCTACHDSWAELSDFGEQYRDNGYQLPGRTDSLVRDPTSLPISVRTSLLYQHVITTNQPTDAGPATVASGGVGGSSADLLIGGSFANNVAALVVASGFASDGSVSLESAWGRFSNIAGSSWLNLRVGQMELDLPASQHRSLSLTAPYALYHFHPQGSANTFDIGENQLGVEVMGHARGVGLRYSLALVNANGNGGTASIWSAPTVWAHVTETWHPFARGLTRIRVGAFGSVGWYPSQFATLTPRDPMGVATGPPVPVPGTGSVMSPIVMSGGELSFTLGPLAKPFIVRVVAGYGQDDTALVANASRSASFAGGFAQVMYTPTMHATLFGRYDFVRSLRAGDPSQGATIGDIDGFGVGARYMIVMSNVAAFAVHLEGSWVQTQGIAAGGNNVTQTILAAGLDVAL
jgi:hypothetical protein